jgi:crotonobetainyl-CoA:carnitine CoA-transferase CaiB-like acyl-CoA transferase
MSDGPLSGLRVLDLSRVLSGPSCTKVLADLGADVIKAEPPEGDLTRTAHPRVGGIPVYFAQQNCGKRCISVDLSRPEGVDLCLRLAAESDIVVENFRPGVLDRLGLGYSVVAARHPRVIYCSITGYGQDGPAAGRRAYAPVMHAELGLMEFSARKHRRPPEAEAVSHGDLSTGMQAAIAILAALHHRSLTGRGQHLDVSMAETMLQATEWTAVELAGGLGGRLHVFGGFYAPVLTLADGTVVCVPGDPVSTFPAWCAAMDRADLLDDTRFDTRESRNEHRDEMHAELQRFASTFDRFDDFEVAVGRSRMAVGAVRSIVDATETDWAKEREAIIDVGDEGSALRLPRAPWRFSAARAGTRGRAAYQGEHNLEVLTEVLGLGSDEVAALHDAGVLVRRPPGPATV